MATNEFLEIATAGGANVQTQVDYQASADRTLFFADGAIPDANQHGKMFRQPSVIARMVAQAVCDVTGDDMLDDGDSAAQLASFKLLVAAVMQSAEAGAAYTYDAGDLKHAVKRTNAGSAMIDTLPGTGTAVMAAGWFTTIKNADSAGLLALTTAAGAALDGAAAGTYIYLGPGQSVIIYSDGSNYFTIGKPSRARLGANTTLHVATGGSATGAGVTTGSSLNSAQAAWNLAQKNFDLNGYVLTILRANSTGYTDAVLASGPMPGAVGPQSVVFDGSGMANVTVTAANTYQAINGAQITVQNQKLAGANNLLASAGGIISYGLVNIAGSGNQIWVTNGGRILMAGNYTISANATTHIKTEDGGYFELAVYTATVSGTPAFALAFAVGTLAGNIRGGGTTWSGAATGTRYLADYNGIINTGGAGANYYPGNVAGSTATGGQYL